MLSYRSLGVHLPPPALPARIFGCYSEGRACVQTAHPRQRSALHSFPATLPPPSRQNSPELPRLELHPGPPTWSARSRVSSRTRAAPWPRRLREPLESEPAGSL